MRKTIELLFVGTFCFIMTTNIAIAQNTIPATPAGEILKKWIDT